MIQDIDKGSLHIIEWILCVHIFPFSYLGPKMMVIREQV